MKPFAEKADLALISLRRRLSGVGNLADPILASELNIHYGEFEDLEESTHRLLSSRVFDMANLMACFWDEFWTHVQLPPAKARLGFGWPNRLDENAEQVFHRSDVRILESSRWRIKGESPGFFDDVCFFDIPSDMVSDGTVDLMSISTFLTAGSTLSFYLPSQRHARWYAVAKKHAIPPNIRCDKRLSVIYSKEISQDVIATVFGVGPTSNLQEPTPRPQVPTSDRGP